MKNRNFFYGLTVLRSYGFTVLRSYGLTVFFSAATTLMLSGCIFLEELDTTLVEYERINKFIVDGVKTYYLWESETDWKKYEKREMLSENKDHFDFFGKLMYRDDHWSTLTEDIKGLENQFSGISTTFGYTLKFYYTPFNPQKDEVVAVILYTSPNSPASKANLKRGDVIVEMNGKKLTPQNYTQLYSLTSIQLRLCLVDIENETITTLPDLKSLTAVEMYENPIHTSKIIEKGANKIGYLCYTGYQRESENELFQLFSDFKSAGVNEVVLDLRYNTGGYSRTAQILSSLLVPEAEVKRKSVYLMHHYNTILTEYLNKNGQALNETFVDTLPPDSYMNLKRLYVLTGKNTASASEATIVGLTPYLQMILIGDTTAGKYCGGALLSPEDIYGEKNKSYYQDFANWGMYIMIYRFANKNGINSFSGPIVPTILAMENNFNLKPFGDETDPLLGRALAHIQGISYVETRSATLKFPLFALPAPKKPGDGLLITEPKIVLDN